MAPVLGALLALAASCTSAEVRGYRVSPIERIGVIPFEDLSGAGPEAGQALTSLFLAKLCEGNPVTVVFPGDMEEFLRDERIRRTDELTSEVLLRMHERLGADAVVIGTVQEYGNVTEAGGLVPLVGLSVRLVDTQTGTMIWGTVRSREGVDGETVFGFGRVRSMSRLSDQVVDEAAEGLLAFIEEAPLRPAAAAPEGPTSPEAGGEVPRTPDEQQEMENVRRQAGELWRRYREGP